MFLARAESSRNLTRLSHLATSNRRLRNFLSAGHFRPGCGAIGALESFVLSISPTLWYERNKAAQALGGDAKRFCDAAVGNGAMRNRIAANNRAKFCAMKTADNPRQSQLYFCLLYTSDAADE